MPRGRALCYTRAENSHHHPDLLPNLSTFMRHYSQSGAKEQQVARNASQAMGLSK